MVEADPDADEMDRTIGSLRRVYQRICVAYILSQCAGTFQSSVLSSEQRQQTADEVLAQAVDSLRDKARSIHQSYIRLKTASDPGDQLEIIRSDAMAAWTMVYDRVTHRPGPSLSSPLCRSCFASPCRILSRTNPLPLAECGSPPAVWHGMSGCPARPRPGR